LLSAGAASGVSEKGVAYGNEYSTLFRVDNVKFVQRKEGAANVPLETMSAEKNRVYALINGKGQLKAIAFYDKSGKKKRQIDLTHHHDGKMPHVHIGYDHSDKGVPLTKSDEAYIKKVRRIWEVVK
jgi:hypothetical protein